MEQFRTYSPEDIILSNLDETADRQALLFEQELAHIAEFAREWMQSRPQDEELLSSLSDIGIDASKLHPDEHPAHCKKLLEMLESIHTIEKNYLLSHEIGQSLTNDPCELINMLFLDAENRAEQRSPHIHYQKNSFTDAAYLQFAKLFETPRASYTHSYQSACEDVFNNLYEYCILPIENTTEGRLAAFLKMIDRYALKLIATCDIPISDGSRATRFALLGKQILHKKVSDKGIRYFFEISCQAEPASSPSEWLTAASLCELQVINLHTIPSEASDGGSIYHAVFEVTEQSALTTFLIYLAIQIPQFIPVGLYPHFPFLK